MIEYFFKVVLCSSLFIGFYFLLLQKEKMFRFNRAYLLITLSLSLSIPFFFITLPNRENLIENIQETFLKKTQIKAKENIENKKNENTIEITEKNAGINSPQHTILLKETKKHTISERVKFFKWENILLFFYISTSSLLIIKFLINFFRIYLNVFKSKKMSYNGIFLVINERKEPLYSFWKYIFIPKQNLNENFSRKELLEHEIAHIRQRHSIDILIIELIKSIFWFNPAFYLFKKAIQLNHEFLADDSVLKTKTDIYEYQKLILDTIQVKQTVPIASNFNYILTKKRLLMMTRKKNSTRAILLQFFSLPFILILVYIFSNKVYAQDKITNELTPRQKEQLKQALQIDVISNYLKDTLESGSHDYIDTLMVGNKAYVISTSKEALDKIFKNEKNQKVSKLPKKEFSKIFENSNIEEIEKAFAIKELNEEDKQKIWIRSTNSKEDNNTYSYKDFPIKSRSEKEQITVKYYYNSTDPKKKVEEMEKKNREISEPYNTQKIDKEMENDVNIKQKIKKDNSRDITILVNRSSEKSDMDEFKEEMRKFRQEMSSLGRQIRNLSKN